MWLSVAAQGVSRELNIETGGTVEVKNLSGRVSVLAIRATGDTAVPATFSASSDKAISDKEVKVTGGGSRVTVTVEPSERDKRIDLVLNLPERTRLVIETSAGAIDAQGNFAVVEAKTETGTIATDVPDEDLKYHLLWIESRPRYLADFDIEDVKEKSAGRFEIKGHRIPDEVAEVKSKKVKGKSEELTDPNGPAATTASKADSDKKPEVKKTKEEKALEKARERAERAIAKKAEKAAEDAKKEERAKAKAAEKEERAKAEGAEKEQKLQEQLASKSVELRLTTARGIILLNVPPNEVASDLRERPLTNAAKAIIRSGDSLLMEAIRRASPKYFGDYASTLPPFSREPSFSPSSSRLDVPVSMEKTALVRVTDVDNRAIPGLRAGDFEVFENGTPREIVSVERSTAPFNLVLLLDVSGSVENYVNFIRKAARSFVATVGPQDRVSIVIFNEDVKVLSAFTTRKDLLSESLDTFDAGGGTAYYDALAYSVSDTLRPLRGERTAIVILTDGDDTRSFLPFDSLIGSIQESGALIYPLYVPSGLIALASQNTNADIDPTRKKYMSLTAKSEGEGERLAKVSGGVYYPINQVDQIQRAYEDIVVQMRSAYNITYRSSGTPVSANGSTPRLKIRAKRENTFATVTSVTAATSQNRDH